MILVQGFCPLKIKITQFPDGFHLNIFCNWPYNKFTSDKQVSPPNLVFEITDVKNFDLKQGLVVEFARLM